MEPREGRKLSRQFEAHIDALIGDGLFDDTEQLLYHLIAADVCPQRAHHEQNQPPLVEILIQRLLESQSVAVSQRILSLLLAIDEVRDGTHRQSATHSPAAPSASTASTSTPETLRSRCWPRLWRIHSA